MLMINSGAFPLKKHNDFCKKLFICFFILITIFLVSCKSAETGNVIDPLNLLSGDQSYYCSIPSDFDDGIYEQLQENFSIEISQNNIELIKKYIDLFYISTNSLNKLDSIDVIICGDFPAGYITNSLSKNKNLTKNILQNEVLSKKYKFFSYNGLNICILSKQLAVITTDLLSVLCKYENQMYSNSYDLSQNENLIPAKIHDFIFNDSGSIRMYAATNNIVSDFIKSIANIKIELPGFEIYQEINTIENNDKYYLNSITAEFENKKFAKTTKTLLNFISPFPDNVIIKLDGNFITIENLYIEKEKIFN